MVIRPSAIATLAEMVRDYKRRNIYVAFVKLREPLLDLFHRSGIMELLGKNCVFNKVRDAIAAYQDTRVFDDDVCTSYIIACSEQHTLTGGRHAAGGGR